MNKYLVLLISFCLMNGARAIDEVSVFMWSQQVVEESLTEEEKTCLLNVLYWSAERSRMILVMQESSAAYIQLLSSVLNDTMAARLNPARLTDILGYSTQTWTKKMESLRGAEQAFREQTEYYRYVCATYAQCIEYLLKTNLMRPALDHHLRTLRNNARIVRIKKFKDNMLSIQSWMDNLKTLMSKANIGICGTSRELVRGFSEYILDFTQPALLKSFVAFDKKYTLFNQRAWDTLTVSYTLGNLIWTILEEVRFEFYKSHYQMLSSLVCSGDVVCLSAFNPDGFIEPQERREWLVKRT